MGRDMKVRCGWAGNDPEYIRYHDTEWGVPVHDDIRLFEMLVLEGAQAGLSWLTILRKRENYRHAFDRFDPTRVAAYDETKISALLENGGIVRYRLKIRAAVANAQAVLRVRQEFGSFNTFIWQLAGGKPLRNAFTDLREIPSQTPASERMSTQLRKRGFRFVGPTICYAFMQATGMVNDHLTGCFRYRKG